MKRYIRASYNAASAIQEFNRKMLSNPNFQIEVSQPANGMFGRGGYIYIFKVTGGTNVYRVFADDKNMELIFQQIEVAFYVNGVEHYDEAVDYMYTTTLPIDEWFYCVKMWAEDCEEGDPNFTQYEN